MLKLATHPTPTPTNNAKLGIARGWMQVAGDSISLAELQLRMFRLDTKKWLDTTWLTVAVFASGITFIVAGLPFLFAAAALGLTLMSLPWLWALLIVGSVATLAGILFTVSAISRFGRTFSVFERSQTEMANNVEWLKKQFSESQQ